MRIMKAGHGEMERTYRYSFRTRRAAKFPNEEKEYEPAKTPGVKLSKNEDECVPEMLYKSLP
jgi:hypothetical protein